MNSQLYVGLVGPEQTIKEFASKVKVPHALVKQLARNANPFAEMSWQWRTARRNAYTEFPEDSVVPLLRQHENVLDEISSRRHNTHFSVTLICQFDENESPSGFLFSRETIEVMAQFGASLEIDAVLTMAPPEQAG